MQVVNHSLKDKPAPIPMAVLTGSLGAGKFVVGEFVVSIPGQRLTEHADGGLTLYIQSTSPGKDKESNWLPSTQSGAFFLIMRTYMPGAEIVEQKWAPPPVTEATGGAT